MRAGGLVRGPVSAPAGFPVMVVDVSGVKRATLSRKGYSYWEGRRQEHGGHMSSFTCYSLEDSIYLRSHMNGPRQTLAFATAVLALPLFAYSQNSSNQNSYTTQSTQTPLAGHHEATQMKPARAVLVYTLDADKDHDGSSVAAKLDQKITLDDGTQLPKGTMLLGKVAQDDMQQQGEVKLAVRFDQARLKDGSTLPVRATIVGLYGGQVPNSWTPQIVQTDQENVVSGVDLHSKISSQNSGVFVSTKKNDIKLRAGSEIQFAIGPAANQQNSTSTGGL
jgi:hypothetical protein